LKNPNPHQPIIAKNRLRVARFFEPSTCSEIRHRWRHQKLEQNLLFLPIFAKIRKRFFASNSPDPGRTKDLPHSPHDAI
jgi:hypothetical protein